MLDYQVLEGFSIPSYVGYTIRCKFKSLLAPEVVPFDVRGHQERELVVWRLVSAHSFCTKVIHSSITGVKSPVGLHINHVSVIRLVQVVVSCLVTKSGSK